MWQWFIWEETTEIWSNLASIRRKIDELTNGCVGESELDIKLLTFKRHCTTENLAI